MPSWICVIMLEDTIQTWTPLVETINAKMEFMPLDAELAAGNTLRLSLLSTGEDYLPASTSSVVFIQEGESSTLQLDTFDFDSRISFTPPVCTHERCVTTASCSNIVFFEQPNSRIYGVLGNSSSTANNGSGSVESW